MPLLEDQGRSPDGLADIPASTNDIRKQINWPLSEWDLAVHKVAAACAYATSITTGPSGPLFLRDTRRREIIGSFIN